MPGLFSRYGALGNPLFPLLAAGQVGSDVAQSNLAAMKTASMPDPQSMIFANQAYQTGQLVDQAPRAPGLFSNLGVKIGLLSPNVTQRPKDVTFELEALDNRRKQQQETLSKEVDWWTKVGSKNFEKLQQEPSMRQMTMFATGGDPTIPVEGPTVREQAIQAVEGQREFTRKADLMRLQLATNEQQLRLNIFARKSQEPIPGTQEWYDMIGRRTDVITHEHEKTLNELENNDWTEWHRRHPAWELHNADTGAYIPDTKYKTPGEAIGDAANVKVLKNPMAIKQANTTAALIDTLTTMKSDILKHVLVDGTGKSNLTTGAETTLNALLMKVNWLNQYKKEFNAANDAALTFAGNIATNHGMTKEVASILHGELPTLTDNVDIASKKIDKVIKDIKIAGGFAVDKIGNADVSASARTDFFSDPGLGSDLGSGSMDMPSTSVVPAMPAEPSGMSGVSGIAGGTDEGATP